MTLKRFKISDLVRIMKFTGVVLDNCKAFSEFWSSNSIGTTKLLHDYGSAVVNKTCGCATKIPMGYKKGTLKLDEARSKLKAEIDEMNRRCTTHVGRVGVGHAASAFDPVHRHHCDEERLALVKRAQNHFVSASGTLTRRGDRCIQRQLRFMPLKRQTVDGIVSVVG